MANKKFNLEEFLNQRTKNEKTLGMAAALLVFIALMHGIVIGPILSKMQLIDVDISSRRDEIRRDRRIVSFKDRIYEEYAKSNTYLDANEKSSEEIIAALLKKIESMAKQQNVVIKDIRPGDTEVKPQFQVYKTSIDCEGAMADLLALMNSLEQSDYLFQITRYSLAPKSKGADILKASMDIARYLIPAEKVSESVLAEYQSESFVLEASPSQDSMLPSFPDIEIVEDLPPSS
ncbi:MAG TPA: hypothetical protein PLY88_03430 [Candidatus Omnitrophota bacterium]|nr:hypothetical protein [Candidatus Omnitrophota bacterium]HRK61584.1 hypothetical protein [Candidatus Omnitrophota bacterium]